MTKLRSAGTVAVISTVVVLSAVAQSDQPTNSVAKSPGQSFFQTLPSLLWVALTIVLIVYFKKELKGLVRGVVLRLNSGSAVKFGPVEIAGLSSIPAVIPSRVSANWEGHKLEKDDGSLRDLWHRYPSYSKYAMLVHKLFPSSEPDQVYDVLLYLIEREAGALLAVSKVEYYFGPFWNDYIYPSIDRSRGFPIKVSAYDRFICIAKLHFVGTKETAIVFRYVDFEMGAYATMPTEPAKPARDLPSGGPPIEIAVNAESTPAPGRLPP